MKANANQIRAALDRPSDDIRLYLLHGPDESGAFDLAARLARAMGADAERIDLDTETLRADPARLAAEAASLALFGGRRHIRIADATDDCLAAIEPLLSAPRAGNPVVAIGATLRNTSKLVKRVLDTPMALAHACYAPDAGDGERLARTIAAEHGLRAVGNVASRLFAACGGDRAIIAREVEKFALYLDAAPERPATLDDAVLDALSADASEAQISGAVNALIGGDAAALGEELARLGEGGASLIPLLRGVLRHLLTLNDMRSAADRGEPIDRLLAPPRVFFRDKPMYERALRRWSLPAIGAAITEIARAERLVKQPGSAGDVIAAAACVRLARAAGRAR